MDRFGLPLTRRGFLAGSAAVTAGIVLALPRRARAFELPEATRGVLSESPLVYVSPFTTRDVESTCHGEVWFVVLGADVLVVTSSDRWKARAIASGRTSARLWVGDFGVWTQSDGKFRNGPTFLAAASFEKDRGMQERALEGFGKKYPNEWGKWGPRFREGLADGSRLLIRYAPRGA